MCHRLTVLSLAVAGLAASVASAAPVLIDFTNGSATATAADFAAAGVTEDISGATVAGVNIAGGNWGYWNHPPIYANSGLSLNWTSGADLFAYASSATGKLSDEVLYTDQTRFGSKTVGFNVAGLSTNLAANSDYKAYVFVSGLWTSDPRYYQMDYGTAHVTGNLSSGSYLLLPFNTGATVADTLDITMGDASGYPGVTAIAIVAVPEPAILGCVAAVGGLLALRRRR
jgi:hypothetical protein